MFRSKQLLSFRNITDDTQKAVNFFSELRAVFQYMLIALSLMAFNSAGFGRVVKLILL